MHREISHTDGAFSSDSRLSLYLLTGLIGLIIGIDVWPTVAAWTRDTWGWSPPTWPRFLYGYRWAVVAAVLGGARILYGSIESLLEGRIGADLAVAIACIAAILFGKPLVAAEVVFVGMLGECLEAITFERTQRAIRGLVEVFPRRCWLLRDGQEVRVLASDLHVGDRVVVKPGARIPADGVVVDGRSALDTSALTGESLPVDVGPESEVLAGSLNQFGALTIEARRVAEHTVVGRVIELTARALKDKATLERTADRLARYFLPLVLALAALTFVGGILLNFWSSEPGRRTLQAAAAASIDATLAVLVVACPCALILATPAAIIAALGRLAGTGILIKGGSALERLATVSAFAFDKTGTLTEGKLELGEVAGLNSIDADTLLRIAATAEQRSEHPLARLILQEAAARKLALDAVVDFFAHPGAGVTSRTRGQGENPAEAMLVVGTRRLLEEQGIDVSAEARELLARLDAAGQSPLLVARDGVVLGAIGARDRARSAAVEVLAELRNLGITDIALLTGDRPAAAQALATQLGIQEVHTELLPADKAAFLERWRRELPALPKGLPDAEPFTRIPWLDRLLSEKESATRRVAMMGDGVNDAPALATADVGLAIGGTGADVAAEAGDIVFMGDPLRSLPLLVDLSRATVRIIRQNILIFAILVNAVGITVTAWLWPLLTPKSWHEEAPLAAVLYHQFGSLAVLLNSMRLLWFGRTRSSPTVQRTKVVFEAIDRWLSKYLDPGSVSHWLIHQWKPVLAGVLLFLVGAWALSGCVVVAADEVAVVRRFGRVRDADLGPGLHWTWPWPIDEVVRIQPDRIRTVAIGFQALTDPAAAPGTWGATHREGVQLLPDEAVMITGDGNLVELQATVRYSIASPRTYLFDVSEPEVLLRAAAESAFREAVAGRTFAELLTDQRAQFQSDVLISLKKRLAGYGPKGLGIAIDGLALLDLHPPQEVVADYHKVAQRMEERDQRRNKEEANALKKVMAKESEFARRVRGAKADRVRTRLLAMADQVYFIARLEARTQLSWTEEMELFDALHVAIAGGANPDQAYADYQRRRQVRMAARATLTEFRAFWDMLGSALSQRDKIILDTDKVPGRRQFLLFDPDKFRIPAPVIQPRRMNDDGP